ncbi:hypothetical protein AB0B85_12450 [Micromonospora sp. NPDC049044]|uniref:hypothetical protein n=1 Tax=Micromonospora sp. NPDC049044 TaxID=3154827 RepID=UPI0033C48AE7
MSGIDFAAWLAVPVGAVGAVVATLAWRTSAGARRDQAEAEATRRHREMRPELEVAIDLRFGPDSGVLMVKLVGPREVERYDWIRVEIRDDKERPPPRMGSGVSVEQQRRQVWGPFWFRHGIDGGSEDRRSAEQGENAVTDTWLFSIDRTLAPHWYSGGNRAWRKDYEGAPMRLRIEVGLGNQSWTEIVEVPPPTRSAYEHGDLTVV